MKEARFDFVEEENMSVFTDYYELTMCAAYFENRRNEPATFDLFIRKLPPNRSYFVFAGLEQVLLYLKTVRFNEEQLRYLSKKGFKEHFLEYLQGFKFSGEVWAVPEGTIVFPEEPLIRVTAPIIEAQLIETFILNTVNLQTMVATKASRVVHAARGRSVIEFGLRRTQGTDAGMKAARCSYMAGCNGTSNVLAGIKYDIPVFGTMAHSYIMFFDREIDSFRVFAKTFPETATFLIDTYDDLKGAENAATVAKELEKQGHKLQGVRIDSGNLTAISKKVRKILDKHGLGNVKIFASGDLDEYKIDKLISQGAQVDAFGVGTRMGTSYDRPYVDVVYKLAGKTEGGMFVPAMKLSKGKITLPGVKQVFRLRNGQGKYRGDIIGLEEEKIKGEPLMVNVMEHGEVTYALPTLKQIRAYAMRSLANLPEEYKQLRRAAKYPVRLSPRLKEIKAKLTKQIRTIKER